MIQFLGIVALGAYLAKKAQLLSVSYYAFFCTQHNAIAPQQRTSDWLKVWRCGPHCDMGGLEMAECPHPRRGQSAFAGAVNVRNPSLLSLKGCERGFQTERPLLVGRHGALTPAAKVRNPPTCSQNNSTFRLNPG